MSSRKPDKYGGIQINHTTVSDEWLLWIEQRVAELEAAAASMLAAPDLDTGTAEWQHLNKVLGG